MASGYEKSPDYGGPEPDAWKLALGCVVLALVCAGIFYIRH
jgi:hypothetical protein